MAKYKLLNKYNEEGELVDGVGGILEIATGKGIPLDKANTDYQEYLEWTKASSMNVPEEAD